MIRVARIALIVGMVALMAVVMTGWCSVTPGEVVVVRRLGRTLTPPWGPGIHWSIPLGIDRLDRIRSDSIREVTIGLAAAAASDLEPSAGEAVTGDLNMVRFQATVQYRVAHPVDFVLHVGDIARLLSLSAEASVAQALAFRGIDAVLRSDRRAIAEEVERDLGRTANAYHAGIAIVGVHLTDARPPTEVEADFTAAQSAENERDRRINEARTYGESSTAASRASARAIVETARGAAERTVIHARAEAASFRTLLNEAQQARGLTMRRLYVETVQALLNGVKRKLVLPPGESIDLTILGSENEARPSPPQSVSPPRNGEHAERRPIDR